MIQSNDGSNPIGIGYRRTVVEVKHLLSELAKCENGRENLLIRRVALVALHTSAPPCAEAGDMLHRTYK